MKYRISYGTEAATHHIPALDPDIAERIVVAIATKLSFDPMRFGKPLRYTLRSLRSLRVGDWRVVFKISADEVTVMAVLHRTKAYDYFK